MARTEFIKSARKTKNGNRPKCCTCHDLIEIGQSYYKNSPSRFSGTYSWHDGCAAPRPWMLEPNEKRSAFMSAIEDANDALEAEMTPDSVEDDCRSALDDLGNALRDVASLYEESADNIESGFQHETEQSMEMRDKAQECESAADTVEDFRPDDRPEEDEGEEALDEWMESVIESARDLVAEAEGMMP